MEVYATIFMIIVSNVLSSISSRQRDGTHIPHPKIRRIPIVYFQNHNNDEENQQDVALEYIFPSTPRLLREKITNGDSNRNTQYEANKIFNAEIPTVKSQRESRNLFDYNEFVSRYEIIKSRLHRKKKQSVTDNVHSLTKEPFDYSATNTETVLIELDKSKIKISSTVDPLPEAWANRAKMKYITVRPWNQFCLTCNYPTTLKDYCKTKPTCRTTIVCAPTVPEDLCITTTTCYRYPTKRKKHTKSCSSTKKCDENNQPWLFYSDPCDIPQTTDICATKTTICKLRNKLRNSDLNTKRNHIQKLLMKKPRMKKRNYFLASKTQLGIVNSSLKRYEKGTRKSRFVSDILPITTELIGDINYSEKRNVVPLGIYFNGNNLLSKRNKLKKRSLNEFRNGQNAYIVGLIRSFGKCEKDRNLTKGLPSCQKSCNYNLTNLVNAQTIKPPDYFKKQPSLELCCEDEANTKTSTSEDEIKNLMSLSTSDDEMMDLMSSSTSEDEMANKMSLSTSEDEDKNTKTVSISTALRSTDVEEMELTTIAKVSYEQQSANPDVLYGTDAPGGTPDVPKISVPPVFRVLMQLRTMPTKTVSSVSRKPKEKFYLKLLLRNKEELTDSNSLKFESELDHETLGKAILSSIMKKRGPKKLHPWDSRKFCPCSEGKKQALCCTDDPRGNKLPWVSTCCYASSEATGKSSRSTRRSNKSTSKSSKSTNKETGESSSVEASSSGAEASSSGVEASSSGAEASSSGVETSSSGVEASSSGTEVTSSSGQASNKRRKNTTSGHKPTVRRRKTSNVGMKAKVTSSNRAKISTVKYTVENTVLRSSTVTAPTSEETNLNLNKLINHHKSVVDDENILLVLRVPVTLAQKYSQNGKLGLVLPLSNTSFPKYVKPRSIFEQLFPCLLRKTTVLPVHHLLTTSEKKFNLLTTASNVRKDNDYLPFTTTDKSSLLNLNVHKHIYKACPSCLKKRKEIVFQTSYGDKKANCIIGDNNLFYEEQVEHDYTNSYGPSTEECDGKYVSYLLKFPKETLSSPSVFKESGSTRRGLTILHSRDSPQKYFVEVPQLLASVMNMDDDTHVTSLESISPRENAPSLRESQKQLRHDTSEKPIVLCLQPFGINGHKVYLPVTGINKPIEKKLKAPVYIRNTDAGDYLDDAPIPSSGKPFISGFLGNNDSVLPFALIPAYLAMHPSKAKSSPVNVREDQRLDLDSVPSEVSIKKNEDIALTVLLNNLLKEKKPIKHSKQVKGVALHPPKMTPRSSGPPKKSPRTPTSSKPPVALDRPTFIILLKDISNNHFLDDLGFSLDDDIHSSTMEQMRGVSIEPLREYIN